MTTLEKFRLNSVVWDSDKDPNGFHKWIGIMGSLVRATAGGAALEEFLDAKLGRVLARPATVPSFLSADPDFESPGIFLPPLPAERPEPASPSISADVVEPVTPTAAPEPDGSWDGGSKSDVDVMRRSDSTLGRAPVPYKDLPKESTGGRGTLNTQAL
jgi:hypothetical protein